MSSRVQVYDAELLAANMVETFNDRPWEYQVDLPFEWPRKLQNVGDSLAIAYASDKWKPKNAAGRRQRELYKHIAESRNGIFVRPGLLRDFYSPKKRWPVCGPMVSFVDCPMPRHFAVLGLFEEASLRLYQQCEDGVPRFGTGDDGVVKITVRHGMLGASKILWSRNRDGTQDEPFLFIYTKESGILAIIVGEELRIEKDGIAG